jgi:hypothetical protein
LIVDFDRRKNGGKGPGINFEINWIRKLNGDAAIFKDLEVGLDCGPLI